MTEFRDTLLALTSYPEPTPDSVIDQAVEFSKLMGAQISALVFVLNRSREARMHSMREWLIDIPSLIDEAIRKSENEAERVLTYFESAARKRNIFQQKLSAGMSVFPSPDGIIDHARVHDVTFLPIVDQIGFDELYTEDVIFGSGRPTILLPAMSDRITPAPVSLDLVAVAWDHSRAAARALADAMPILEKAKRVLVFTVFNEKPVDANRSGEFVDQHLRLHGVNATVERVDAGTRSIGTAIEEYVTANHADMLVMGAFGHSRLREFILGGATRSILNRPPVPVLLAY